jgi:hypothetical protein
MFDKDQQTQPSDEYGSNHIQNGVINEEQILAYVHTARKKIVNKLMPDGQSPADVKEIQTLAGVLSDMERPAIAKLKMKSDEKAAGAAGAGGAALVASLLKQFDVNKSTSFIPGITPPVLGDELPVPTTVPGETTQGTSNLTYEKFAKEHFKNNEI